MPEFGAAPGGRADVEFELGDGTFTLRWPGLGVELGPCRAAAIVDGIELVSGAPGSMGSWHLVRGDSGGEMPRAGSEARWTSDDGVLSVRVRLPVTGPVVVVEAEVRPAVPSMVDRVTPLMGATDLGYDRRLVDGYDSWAYSGVRSGAAGASFWNTAFLRHDCEPEARAAIAMQALDASRLCARFTNDGPALRADCGAAPPLVKVPGTWGYLVGAPPPLALPVDADGALRTPPIAIAAGPEAPRLVEDLAALAGQTMGTRRWAGPRPNGWESWYHYGLFVTVDDVLANARALRERYAGRDGFDLVQVDDGWQATYGAWWPNERFPADLGDLVDRLRGLGCRAGLWLAPFRVQPGGVGVAADHPEWCVRDEGGGPLLETRHGTWALDASHPDAVAWIRELGARVRSWGFEMVKVDFCYLGALQGHRHDPRVTGIEALRRGMAALVDGLGDDVYVLGCGMPVLPAVGICHGNRVGHDLAMPVVHQSLGHPVDDGWTGFTGVRAEARNVAARWYQAGRWYDADPEVVMAWGGDGGAPAGYPVETARALATMVAIVGGPFLLADDLTALGPDERAVLEHPALLDLVGSGPFRPVDGFEPVDPDDVPEHVYSQGPGIPSTWSTTRGGGPVVAWFNWGDRPVRRRVPARLRAARELWTGAVAGAELEIPARGVRVVRG